MKFGVTESERKLLAKTDLFIAQTERYIVLRLVPGETLSMRLRREHALSPETVLRIASDIVSQLCVCHEAGFAHNGLTIENVFLDLSEPNIRAYLTGYGNAAESSDFTADCIAVGKIIYHALYGEEQAGPIKIPATTDKDAERLCALMVNALSGEFKSASMMKECLEGKELPAIVRNPVGPGFSAVAGMESLKKRLKEDVIDIITQSEEAKKYGLTIPNGMLLYGPPGCGKTFIAEKFAEEAAYNYKYVKTSDLASVYLHGSQTKIAELFDEAHKKRSHHTLPRRI